MAEQGKQDQFHKLYLIYTEAYPRLTKQKCQKEVNELWKLIKTKEKNYDTEISRLKVLAQEKKVSLYKFWTTHKTEIPTNDIKSSDSIIQKQSDSP